MGKRLVLVPPALGYHTDESGDPRYDPGLDVPCPFCLEQLTKDNVRTFNLMQMERRPHLSVFYRTHRTCHEEASQKEQNHLDQIVMTTIEALVENKK